MELTPLTTCPTTILDGDASLGSHTPPLTHDYGTGIISSPTVAPEDTVADVELTPNGQFTVSEIFAGYHTSVVNEEAFYGTDWIIRIGTGGQIYVKNASYHVGADSLYYGSNQQTTMADDATAGYISNDSITGGDRVNVYGRNDSIECGDDGNVLLDSAVVHGGLNCNEVRGYLCGITAGAGSNANGIKVHPTVLGVTGTALGVDAAAYGGAYRAAAMFGGGPIAFETLTTEPGNPSVLNFSGSSYLPDSEIYAYDNAGAKELRTNVNGNIVVLAVG